MRLYWTWNFRRRPCTGRPATPPEIRNLLRQLVRENPLWGAPRVHGELQMLGIVISQTTLPKTMIRHCKPPSQTWRTFLGNDEQPAARNSSKGTTRPHRARRGAGAFANIFGHRWLFVFGIGG